MRFVVESSSMIIKETQPPLAEIIARQNQSKRWKNGMAHLQVEKISSMTGPGSQLRPKLTLTRTVATVADRGFTSDRARGYDAYNLVFRAHLQKEIVDLLCDIARLRNGRQIRILDDGAGDGNFLHEIKIKLAKKGISAKTTACTLNVNEKLKSKNVDIVYDGYSEMLVPEEKQDLIISVMGTLWYTLNEINKEIILKHTYSLAKGGYLLLMTTGVSPNLAKSDEEAIRHVDDVYRRIKQSFKKRGFEVISACDEEGYGVLIVKRLD